MLTVLSEILDIFLTNNLYRYLLYSFVTLIVYLIYRAIFKGMTFRAKGNYDTKLKNIGRPLPAYPNGWYVALRSDKLEKGRSEAVDIAG